MRAIQNVFCAWLLLWGPSILWAKAPIETPAQATSIAGYLVGPNLPALEQWLPTAPAADSSAEKADIEAFQTSRALIIGKDPRAQKAAADDVYAPIDVLARFQDATGRKLDDETAPTLIHLLERVEDDAQRLVKPVKLPIKQGGRARPFVRYPDAPSCLFPDDLAGHRDRDIEKGLPDSGSYPSGHALLGMLVGLILSDVLPARTDAVLARGIEFGDSRFVCGFHYPSDLVGGRIAAAGLFARLNADPVFATDLAKVRKELSKGALR